MPETVMIDTDILIDVGRSVQEAVTCLDHLEQNFLLTASAITHMELLIGCSNKREVLSLERFLERLQIIKIDAAISDKAVGLLKRYRLSHGLLIADSLIAASALVFHAPLITKNQRDFRFIADLTLLAYPPPNR